jgi:hypothetical protein
MIKFEKLVAVFCFGLFRIRPLPWLYFIQNTTTFHVRMYIYWDTSKTANYYQESNYYQWEKRFSIILSNIKVYVIILYMRVQPTNTKISNNELMITVHTVQYKALSQIGLQKGLWLTKHSLSFLTLFIRNKSGGKCSRVF